MVKKSRAGAIIPLVAVLLPVTIFLIAMIINVAYIELARTELRIATDAAARAGGRELSLTGDIDQAKAAARDAAGRNLVAGSPLLLADDDFTVGVSTRPTPTSRYNFNANSNQNPNSLQIMGRRKNGGASGSVSYFMPNVLGRTAFELEQRARSTQIELDLSLVVDRSGSMAYSDIENATQMHDQGVNPAAAPAGWSYGGIVPPNSRWLDMIAATNVLLDMLEQTPQTELVSLTTYASTASRDIGLTGSYNEIIDGLNDVTQAFHGGGTNIGGGIANGAEALVDTGSRPWATKVAIVLTDGVHNTGTNPVAAAASTEDVTIYTITFSQEAEQRDMRRVARKTGGNHFHASSGQALIDAFREVAKSLPTLITE